MFRGNVFQGGRCAVRGHFVNGVNTLEGNTYEACSRTIEIPEGSLEHNSLDHEKISVVNRSATKAPADAEPPKVTDPGPADRPQDEAE